MWFYSTWPFFYCDSIRHIILPLFAGAAFIKFKSQLVICLLAISKPGLPVSLVFRLCSCPLWTRWMKSCPPCCWRECPLEAFLHCRVCTHPKEVQLHSELYTDGSPLKDMLRTREAEMPPHTGLSLISLYLYLKLVKLFLYTLKHEEMVPCFNFNIKSTHIFPSDPASVQQCGLSLRFTVPVARCTLLFTSKNK